MKHLGELLRINVLEREREISVTDEVVQAAVRETKKGWSTPMSILHAELPRSCPHGLLAAKTPEHSCRLAVGCRRLPTTDITLQQLLLQGA